MKRASIVVLILCAGLMSTVWCQPPASKCSNNWSEFHRPNMQRWNPCEKELNINNVRNLILKWSYSTGNQVNSPPAVANGVVYVGSFDSRVYALNSKTGTLLWSYATGNLIESSPAVANGVVYIGSEDNNLYAFGLK